MCENLPIVRRTPPERLRRGTRHRISISTIKTEIPSILTPRSKPHNMRDLHKLLLALFLICSTAAAAQNQDSLREKSSERKILWDEENRMKAVSDNGYTSYYSYDASGERVLKQAGSGEGVHVNSEFSGGNTQTNQYTLYTSPYIVIKNGAQYTKHIYIGTQRIVSKMGDASTYQGADPRRVPKAGDALDPAVRPNWQEKIKLANDDVKTIYDSLKVPYSGSSSAPPFIICPTCSSATAGGNTTTTTPTAGSTVGTKDVERLMFYYHPDHLGSSAYITNLNGEVAQHMEYVPFGEVFLEERNGIYNTPYKFNAKELDEETGLYYYGARYYNPKTSLWLSVDPLAETTLQPYSYANNNPIRFADPTGMIGEDTTIKPPHEYEVNLNTGEVKKVSDLGGNEIDFYHYTGGGSQFDGRTRIVDRATGDDQWMSSSKNIKGYSQRGNDINWKNTLYNN